MLTGRSQIVMIMLSGFFVAVGIGFVFTGLAHGNQELKKEIKYELEQEDSCCVFPTTIG